LVDLIVKYLPETPYLCKDAVGSRFGPDGKKLIFIS